LSIISGRKKPPVWLTQVAFPNMTTTPRQALI
jgi:hypothetical protein